jgi:NADPH:quinone reductase-like Zn-dependent oxidoreductase
MARALCDPESMTAWRFLDSFGLEHLKPVDSAAPVAGPGEAVVRVRACSLNFRDLLVAQGAYGRAVRAPLTPLSDGAGEVLSVGAGVTRVKPGDRVCGIFMQRWIEGPSPDDDKAASAMGGAIDGMLSEQVCLNAEGLVHFPDHLSFEEAATLPCAGVTAWNSLFVSGGLKAGESVLTLGSGGVSVFALQFARMAGARVISTSGSDAKIEKLKALGAHDTINYKTSPEWDKQVRSLTGAGVDHVIEVGGTGTLPHSIKSVRRGGHIALIGVVSGGGDMDARQAFLKSVKLQGIYVGSREMFEAMNRAIALARLKPVVDRVFPVAEIREAMAYMSAGSHFGKVCIAL